VLFWEEPVYGADGPWLDRSAVDGHDVTVCVPHLPWGLAPEAEREALAALLAEAVAGEAVAVRWYYTPMMLPFSREVAAARTVYDCMDELANFRFAPPDLLALEDELFAAADIVFTGGVSLWEAKRGRHPDVRLFPSSVDVGHFARARAYERPSGRPPRLGFYGVIDERMDLALVDAVAAAQPDWTIELVGPVVKIDPADLPQRPNLHYPGPRSYDELPGTLAGWDVALMPFAINEATRFISPTKTPEYLAAGRPVVSTPITDVVRDWGSVAAVQIAATPAAFVSACQRALAMARGDHGWLEPVDRLIAATSWNATAAAMAAAVDAPVTSDMWAKAAE
jgi:UDP-galactopyranose mutase